MSIRKTFAFLFLVLLAVPAWAQRGQEKVRRAPRLDFPEQAPSLAAAKARWSRNLAHANPSSLPFQRGSSRPAILLTGYWPPSNEAVRKFSPDPVQNPGGWQGSNWEGRGYDLYAYFPEFNPPDCSFCGRGSGDLEVDYQDTSLDFWPIADTLRPIAVITLSRGFLDNSWEVEMNQYNRLVWYDDYLPPFQPTPAPPDSDEAAGFLRNSSLPVQDIVDAVNQANLGVNAAVCWTGDGGGFLSEFIAYHGVWYRDPLSAPPDPNWCIAAGHIHVGGRLDWPTAEAALEVSVRTVTDYLDLVIAATVCQPDLGYGGPGSAQLAVCGDPLATGGSAEMLVWDGVPLGPGFLVGGFQFSPTAWNGGLVVPVPIHQQRTFVFDDEGRWAGPTVPGGLGLFSYYIQAVYPDASQSLGYGFSNAVQLNSLP
ncbi:MAG: hypothetical protein DWQ01_22010 [Planctomycetota bacterium]|nr:MAG: hypothetical protein DWQ01_22010 [Planctomycetota bacterium]